MKLSQKNDRSVGVNRVAFSLAAVLAVAVTTANTRGAGLLIADGGLGGILEIKEHTVQVTINNGIAVTEVMQVFRNTENRQVEALYTFPVPKGASVANFSMWIGGKEMVGEVVEKKRAREIYDSYRRVRKDPGLLEQTDYKNFEMRIFPIGPGAEQKVQICYYQELEIDHDWATYVYPLTTATRRDAASQTAGKFALTLQVKSAVPIAAMESPSHGPALVVAQHTDTFAEASLETSKGDLNRDLVVAYRVSRPQTGIDLVASKQAKEDGYFCLTLTAGEELVERKSGMDYVFVLDASGSMADGGKLGLSRESVTAFINALEADDRFEIITFNVTPTVLFSRLGEVSEESKTRARTFLETQAARGGTVLRPALATAYQYSSADRSLNVVVLSDGMTQQDERTAFVEMARTKPANARIFCIGVGNEVNRPLLEKLAEDTGGLASFISPGDDFSRQAKAFRRKLLRPAAANLKIGFQGAEVYDVEPVRLPNLFHGTPVRMYGRYRGSGPVKVAVNADVAGTPIEQSADLSLPETDGSNPQIERMWAWHKTQRLLKEVEGTGPSDTAAGEIVRLGEAYSIVTEYTSFIVLENELEYQRWKIDRRNVLRIERDRKPRQQLLAQLEDLKMKTAKKIDPAMTEPLQAGPVPADGKPAAPPEKLASAAPQQNAPARPGDLRLKPGGGPVGPFGVLGVAALALVEWRRRRRNTPCV